MAVPRRPQRSAADCSLASGPTSSGSAPAPAPASRRPRRSAGRARRAGAPGLGRGRRLEAAEVGEPVARGATAAPPWPRTASAARSARRDGGAGAARRGAARGSAAARLDGRPALRSGAARRAAPCSGAGAAARTAPCRARRRSRRGCSRSPRRPGRAAEALGRTQVALQAVDQGEVLARPAGGVGALRQRAQQVEGLGEPVLQRQREGEVVAHRAASRQDGQRLAVGPWRRRGRPAGRSRRPAR